MKTEQERISPQAGKASPSNSRVDWDDAAKRRWWELVCLEALGGLAEGELEELDALQVIRREALGASDCITSTNAG